MIVVNSDTSWIVPHYRIEMSNRIFLERDEFFEKLQSRDSLILEKDSLLDIRIDRIENLHGQIGVLETAVLYQDSIRLEVESKLKHQELKTKKANRRSIGAVALGILIVLIL